MPPPTRHSLTSSPSMIARSSLPSRRWRRPAVPIGAVRHGASHRGSRGARGLAGAYRGGRAPRTSPSGSRKPASVGTRSRCRARAATSAAPPGTPRSPSCHGQSSPHTLEASDPTRLLGVLARIPKCCSRLAAMQAVGPEGGEGLLIEDVDFERNVRACEGAWIGICPDLDPEIMDPLRGILGSCLHLVRARGGEQDAGGDSAHHVGPGSGRST